MDDMTMPNMQGLADYANGVDDGYDAACEDIAARAERLLDRAELAEAWARVLARQANDLMGLYLRDLGHL